MQLCACVLVPQSEAHLRAGSVAAMQMEQSNAEQGDTHHESVSSHAPVLTRFLHLEQAGSLTSKERHSSVGAADQCPCFGVRFKQLYQSAGILQVAHESHIGTLGKAWLGRARLEPLQVEVEAHAPADLPAHAKW